MGFFGALSSTSSKVKRISHVQELRIKNILGIAQLEALPAHAARAFELASDPKSKTVDFVKIIESDEALSARVIRIANSVYFYRGTPANDIDKAVANIGLNELRCLLSATMLRSLLKGKSSVRKQLWGNSVATAMFARGLARFFDNISAGEAFLCGLVHDVGKLVMIRRAPEHYEKVIKLVSLDGKSFIEAEEAIFELNHIEVGQWVAESWRFPESVVEAISRHHRPWPSDVKHIRGTTETSIIVKAADAFAHMAGAGHGTGFTDLKKNSAKDAAFVFNMLGMNAADGDKFIQSGVKEFEQNIGLYELEQ